MTLFINILLFLIIIGFFIYATTILFNKLIEDIILVKFDKDVSVGLYYLIGDLVYVVTYTNDGEKLLFVFPYRNTSLLKKATEDIKEDEVSHIYKHYLFIVLHKFKDKLFGAK